MKSWKCNRQRGRDIVLRTTGERRAFSRFVLPFAWRRGRDIEKPDTEKCYWAAEPPPKLKSRMKYFTRESGNVLYRRAQWLVLRNFEKSGAWAGGEPVYLSGGDRMRARMDTPRMVLFEWGDTNAGGLPEKEAEPDILKTGFLIVDVSLEQDPRCRAPILDDLLLFNEFFRHIDCPYPEHYDHSVGDCFRNIFRDTRISFVNADAKRVKEEHAGTSGGKNVCERHYFNRWRELLDLPVETCCHYFLLLGGGGGARAEGSSKPGEERGGGEADYLVYSDSRTYVWTAAVLEKGVQGLKNLAASPSCRAHDYGHWIKLLNIDSPRASPTWTHQATAFERQWAEIHSYRRWEEAGTWYGFSYHAGAQLTKAGNEDDPNYVEHFSNYYFDIALLLFYLRVTLFRFSGELTRRAPELESGTEAFDRLHQRFTRFTLLYQFPILSNQQQAIEMYDLARKHFDIDDFYEEIKHEIHETYEYLSLKSSDELNRSAARLNRVGLPLVAGGLVAGIFGMNFTEFHLACLFKGGGSDCMSMDLDAIVLLVLVLLGGVISWCLVNTSSRCRRWRKRWINRRPADE